MQRCTINDRFSFGKNSLLTIALVGSAFIVGCGPGNGFQGINGETKTSCVSDCVGGDSGKNEQNSDVPDAREPFPNLNFKANHTGMNEGRLATIIDTQEETLTIYLPMSPFHLISDIQGTVPQLPGLRFGTEFLADGKALLAVHIPLEYLVSNLDWLAPGRLPNGQALPAIPDGELPAINLPLGNSGDMDMHLYIGNSVVGLYVSLPIDPFIRMQLAIRDLAGQKVVGYFVTIPATETHKGGLFMSSVLPPDLARAIDEHFAIK